jgi:hypothetical protein
MTISEEIGPGLPLHLLVRHLFPPDSCCTNYTNQELEWAISQPLHVPLMMKMAWTPLKIHLDSFYFSFYLLSVAIFTEPTAYLFCIKFNTFFKSYY